MSPLFPLSTGPPALQQLGARGPRQRRCERLIRRDRMMLVRDGPLAADLAQAYRQAKIQIGMAVLDHGAAHQGDGERDIVAGGDLQIHDVKSNGFWRSVEKLRPARLI